MATGPRMLPTFPGSKAGFALDESDTSEAPESGGAQWGPVGDDSKHLLILGE